MNDREAILALVQRYLQALRDKDGAALIQNYRPDAVSYELAPPLAMPPELNTDPRFFDPWFETWDGPIVSEALQPTLKISGNLATSYSLTQMRGRKTSGEDVDLWFRSTVVFEKEDGEWKIVHVHNSVPFAMDGSYRALVDLTPG